MSQFPPETPPPLYVPPPSEAPLKDIIVLRWGTPLQWLSLGWRDLTAHPAISLFYGVAFWCMATALGAVFRAKPEFTMTMASGCLLVGPFLTLGLYEVSRRRELGLKPSFAASLTCWRNHLRSMGMLVGVLNTGMPSSVSVMEAVFNPNNLDFVLAYTVVGGIFATLVFAIAAVSIPMILDRDTDAISAAITSLEVVVNNTGVMLLWGGLIATLIAASLLMPWSVGLVVMGPLMGHATWHAYRGTVHWE